MPLIIQTGDIAPIRRRFAALYDERRRGPGVRDSRLPGRLRAGFASCVGVACGVRAERGFGVHGSHQAWLLRAGF